jgi:hypothetical protein
MVAIFMLLFFYYVIFGGVYAVLYFSGTSISEVVMEKFLETPWTYSIPFYGGYKLFVDCKEGV